MTYLTIVQEVAELVGVNPPTAIGDVQPVARRFRRFADRAGQEIARRADWNNMLATFEMTSDGATASWPLPPNFDRLTQGNPVVNWAGDFLRGSVAYDEWMMLQRLPMSAAGADPRWFLLASNRLNVFPVLPFEKKLAAVYVTKYWIVGATTEVFTTDEQTTYFPERLIILNMVWRWRRAQGAPYDDELKEFEAMLAEAASADAGLRPPAAAAA